MWVDDHVRLHSAFRKRHVNGGPFLRTDTLLPVSRRELVSNNGRTWDTQSDLYLL